MAQATRSLPPCRSRLTLVLQNHKDNELTREQQMYDQVLSPEQRKLTLKLRLLIPSYRPLCAIGQPQLIRLIRLTAVVREARTARVVTVMSVRARSCDLVAAMGSLNQNSALRERFSAILES